VRSQGERQAERSSADGDEWVINGQKIWTSGAQHSDYGILITRTDPTVAKHKGMTMFFLDMRSPGVDVRPIKQANGQSEFNEVYFDSFLLATREDTPDRCVVYRTLKSTDDRSEMLKIAWRGWSTPGKIQTSHRVFR
jgi:alkylation response protein AidB-like acyl-CoA dehydrogenase